MLLLAFLFVTSSAVSAAEFSDTESSWAKYSIDYVAGKGYFVGTSATTFSPGTEMSRGMFVTVLARVCGADLTKYGDSKSFSDVTTDSYYAPAISWAYENNIINGFTASTFGPDQNITREQICVVLKNYFTYTGKTPSSTGETSLYKDDAAISSWAKSAVYEMQSDKIVTGSDGFFNPGNKATRDQGAAIIARLCGQFFDSYQPTVTESTTETKGDLIGTFKSTFYSPSASSNGGYTVTATGAPLIIGQTLAVDPDLIPLGSWVYLEFSDARLQGLNGVYHATDTGGAINGYRVDVLVASNSLANSYGVGSVKIYTVNQ